MILIEVHLHNRRKHELTPNEILGCYCVHTKAVILSNVLRQYFVLTQFD